jgi:aspartate/methionine/tyrosine aminotransferase
MEWTRRHGSPYSPNAGFPELRAAIAAYLTRTSAPAARFAPENVCVTVGSEEALYLAIKAVVRPGEDEVLIAEPCYLAYPKICMLEGIDHRMVALDPGDRFRPDADRVLEAVGEHTRLVVINSPGNPTGRVWPERELARLAEGLRRGEGERPVYVLTDEVYRELYYADSPPPGMAGLHPYTLVAGSLSKSNALTGLRIGWLAGPADVVAAATTVHQFVNTSATTFAQRVALHLFSGEGQLGAHRPHYLHARSRLLAAARRAGVDLIPPEGAFYAFIRLPAERAGDSLAAAHDLLERKRVVAVPGRAFGEAGEGWLRISWVLEPERIEEGIERIGAWIAGDGGTAA